MIFSSRKKSATGIHFDDRALYTVELSRTAHGQTELVGLARVELNGEAGFSNLTDDAVCTELTAALCEARGHSEMRFRNPYATLREGSVLLKQRPLFHRKDDHNKEQLEWEAQQFLPDDLNQYALDCLQTARATFVVAARRQAIDQLARICRGAGISRPEVDVAPFALCNAAESSGAAAEGIDLLLDFSRDEATLILLDSRELMAVDMCNWDGRYAMYGAVETARGQTPGPGPGAGEGEEASQSDADTELDSSRGALLARSYDRLAHDHLGSEAPDRVWLSGAEVELGAWGSEIEERMSLYSRPLDPFANVDTAAVDEPLQDSFAYATAAGLAFRGLAEV